MRHAVTAAPPGHLEAFYGLTPLPGRGPLVLVAGNCQAESLRLFLDGDDLTTLRIPPVFELEAGDLPHLHRWLERTALLVTQPVRDDYRGLPLGTRQLAARMPAGAQVVRVPVIRCPGLYPAHAIVRPPDDPGLVPPVVAYHDLRLLLEASGRRPRPLRADGVRAVHALGQRELAKREVAHETVVASDLLEHPAFDQMRTLNHPGNAIWAPLAARVRAAAGLPEHEPRVDRPVLDSVHAPREPVVLEAFGLDGEPVADWTVDGRTVPAADVREAHLAFYAERPDVVAAGLARHAEAIDRLGLA